MEATAFGRLRSLKGEFQDAKAGEVWLEGRIGKGQEQFNGIYGERLPSIVKHLGRGAVVGTVKGSEEPAPQRAHVEFELDALIELRSFCDREAISPVRVLQLVWALVLHYFVQPEDEVTCFGWYKAPSIEQKRKGYVKEALTCYYNWSNKDTVVQLLQKKQGILSQDKGDSKYRRKAAFVQSQGDGLNSYAQHELLQVTW